MKAENVMKEEVVSVLSPLIKIIKAAFVENEIIETNKSFNHMSN